MIFNFLKLAIFTLYYNNLTVYEYKIGLFSFYSA